MRDTAAPPTARCIAGLAILDRGYGKPVQASEVTLRKASVSEPSDSELHAIAAGAADEEMEIEDAEPTAH